MTNANWSENNERSHMLKLGMPLKSGYNANQMNEPFRHSETFDVKGKWKKKWGNGWKMAILTSFKNKNLAMGADKQNFSIFKILLWLIPLDD